MVPTRLINAEQSHEIFHGMSPTTMSTDLHTATVCLSSVLSLSHLQCKHSPITGVHNSW